MKKDEALNILETFLTEEQLSRLKRVSDMTGAPIDNLICHQLSCSDVFDGSVDERNEVSRTLICLSGREPQPKQSAFGIER
jgi:hypothetical protein